MPMSEIVRDRAWLHGTVLSVLAYGTNITLFALTFRLLLKRLRTEREKDGRAGRQSAVLLLYSGITFALATLCVAGEVDMADGAFIVQRSHHTSPALFETENFGVAPVSAMANIAFSVLNWSVDALLLWRCHVIYRNSTAPPVLLLAVPISMFVASFVTGVICLEQLMHKAVSPFRNIGIILVYGTIFFGLNLVLTFMMVIRLVLYRKRITSLVGSRYASHYTSISSILIESASIMDVMLILVLIPLVMHSPLVTTPLLIMPQIQAMASFLIVFRVARGTAWLSGTANELMAQHSDGSTPEGMMAARFRITSQMTQMSTEVHFNHDQPTNAFPTNTVKNKGCPPSKLGLRGIEYNCEESEDVQGGLDKMED